MSKPAVVKDFSRTVNVDANGIVSDLSELIEASSLPEKVASVLISEQCIRERVRHLAREIESEYKGKEVYVVVLLKGAFIFFADLLRELHNYKLHPEFDFMNVSSYAGTESTGKIRIDYDLVKDVKGKHVLIIDDIIDTGQTLKHLKEMLLNKRKACSVKTCALFDKLERRKVDVKSDYTGFVIPDLFVIGYGLDCDEYGRGFPFLGIYKEG